MKVKATDLQLAYLLSTALEQGIGYWAEARKHVEKSFEGETINPWTVSCEIRAACEPTDVTGKWKKLDFETLRRGILWIVENPAVKNQYHLAACVGLLRGDEDADYDCETADLIVQAGLYQEIVYG